MFPSVFINGIKDPEKQKKKQKKMGHGVVLADLKQNALSQPLPEHSTVQAYEGLKNIFSYIYPQGNYLPCTIPS